MKSLDQQFSEFLRKKRGDMSYAEFARITGLTKSAIFKFENYKDHRQSPRLRTVQQVCEKLKCDLTDVFPKGL